jgi:hypothetical protein
MGRKDIAMSIFDTALNLISADTSTRRRAEKDAMLMTFNQVMVLTQEIEGIIADAHIKLSVADVMELRNVASRARNRHISIKL